MRTLQIALLTLFTVFFAETGYAQDTTGTGKIYFIRNTGYNGSALAFHCFIDSARVCDLRNKHFSVHNLPAGTHKLNVTVYSKELKTEKNTMTLIVEKDKSYYIRILPEKAYSFETTLKVLAVSENTAKPVLAKCKEDTNCLK